MPHQFLDSFRPAALVSMPSVAQGRVERAD